MGEQSIQNKAKLGVLCRGYIDIILRHLERKALNVEKFIAQLPYSIDDKQQLSIADVLHCCNAAIEYSGDELFMLRAGRRMQLADFSVIGALSMHAANIKQVMDDLIYFHNATSMGEFSLSKHVEAGRAYVRIHSCAEFSDEEFAPLSDLIMAGLAYNTFVLAYDRSLDALGSAQICFKHQAPADVEAYCDIFQKPVLFSQQHNQICFDESFLHIPLSSSDSDTYQLIRNKMQQTVSLYQDELPVSQRLQSILMVEEKPKLCPIGLMADKLSTSVSTLQRKLQSENTSYRQIQIDALELRAKTLLSKTSLSINEVALQLGYAEANSFHRAFKRWTSLSPGDYREQGPK